MTTLTSVAHDPRIPLTGRNGSSVFMMAIAGLLVASFSPLIMTALQSAGLDIVAVGNALTATLLASAVVSLATSRLAASVRRRRLALGGLLTATAGFILAAVSFSATLTISGMVIAGIGCGAVISTGSAALAALRNPNRATALSGLVNRGIVTLALAVIPLLGLSQFNVFGACALVSLAAAALVGWLPEAPLASAQLNSAASAAPKASRKVTIAGASLLVLYPIWGISEESVWALSSTLGANIGLSEQGIGLALSAATALGGLALILMAILGRRMGRALPLGIAILLSSAAKIALGMTSDPTVFSVLIVVQATTLALASILVFAAAASLDASGKWAASIIGANLLGTSFAPAIGVALFEAFGAQGFGIVMGLTSALVAVPMILIARLSFQVETTELRDGTENLPATHEMDEQDAR